MRNLEFPTAYSLFTTYCCVGTAVVLFLRLDFKFRRILNREIFDIIGNLTNESKTRDNLNTTRWFATGLSLKTNYLF